jgi:hypothetical protein
MERKQELIYAAAFGFGGLALLVLDVAIDAGYICFGAGLGFFFRAIHNKKEVTK